LTVSAQALISNLAARGITLTPNGDSLIVRPRERLTDADRDAIRQSKPALLAHLRAGVELRRARHPLIEADRERVAIHHIARLDAERREADRQARGGYDFDRSAPEPGRAAWTRSATPDSRHPLIEPAVRAKLEAIEADAREKGWPADLLWNANFWDRPRGLAAVLDPGDEITEVAVDHITILKVKRDLLNFRRHAA
jgi:TubC N-terminal docking domain